MTTHFSYPNVIPRQSEFIGCGRYTIFSGENLSKSDYREITDTPNTPNKTALEHALQLIAPDSFDSGFSIFEKKDEKDRVYQGDSLDLAYFLAHINRSRKLTIETKGDIWSTGVIQVFESQPVLRKVDQIGFDIKLSHFLSNKCDDTLFIVSAANLKKGNIQKAKNENIRIISLSQLQNQKSHDFNTRKTILKVLPNELPDLVNFIFDTKKDGRKKNFVWWLAALIICILGFMGWGLFNNRVELSSPEEITALLENGDFDVALDSLKKVSKSDPSYHELKDLIETPLHIDIKFQYKMADQKRAESRTIDLKSQKKLTLSHRDLYRFRIESSVRNQILFVYVFQTDQAGNIDSLFPNPAWAGQNPMSIDQWPLNIPPGNDQWLYLDLLPNEITTRMTESIHTLVSPWRANDIEEYYDKFQKASDSDQSRMLIDIFLKQVRLRDTLDLPGIYYREFSFFHSK